MGIPIYLTLNFQATNKSKLAVFAKLGRRQEGEKLGDWGDSPYSLLRSCPQHVVFGRFFNDV